MRKRPLYGTGTPRWVGSAPAADRIPLPDGVAVTRGEGRQNQPFGAVAPG
ncbi:MAG TPA: hypothetical protein VMB47_15560 [Candidatus Aquilonibacter sp.]|nr:hypothetical protein [Candidatus Aquilonibacter sp.]